MGNTLAVWGVNHKFGWVAVNQRRPLGFTSNVWAVFTVRLSRINFIKRRVCMQPIDLHTHTISDDDLAFDRQHIWHPYSSMSQPANVWPVVAADGVRLTLQDGRELIDGMASWWSVIHGYNHPRLNAALAHQGEHMSHVMFGGLTHAPAIGLAQRLVAITPDLLDTVFLADSGSIAVEVALKMAIQYQQARGLVHKHRVLAFERGYHGDTLGAMSLCDPKRGMHHLFAGLLPKQHFAPAPHPNFGEPWQDDALGHVRCVLEQHAQELAAVVIEPVVQGAGGMRFYHPKVLSTLRALCDEFDVLLIADEIATGFGRTGRLFACEHAGVTPDIMCLGKALTGGYMTLAATLTSAHIADTISQGEAGCFMHGPTFMANPLACRVACASIDELNHTPWQPQVALLEEHLKQGLAPARDITGVVDVRVLGAIGVIEVDHTIDVRALQPLCVEQGIWVRPFGTVMYVMPPYVMSADDTDTLCRGMVHALAKYLGDRG